MMKLRKAFSDDFPIPVSSLDDLSFGDIFQTPDDRAAARKVSYLDQAQIVAEMEDALLNRKVVDQSASRIHVSLSESDAETEPMPFVEFANSPKFQDDEAWAYPYGWVDAVADFKVRDYVVEVDVSLAIEEGYAHHTSRSPVEVWLHDLINGPYRFDELSRNLSDEVLSWQGGAEFWFSADASKSFVNDLMWDDELFDRVSYAIAERDEYSKMMGYAAKHAMRIDAFASPAQYDKLESQGWEFESYEYDYDAQQLARSLEQQGYEAKLLRERTDTQGIKMYSVWKKKTSSYASPSRKRSASRNFTYAEQEELQDESMGTLARNHGKLKCVKEESSVDALFM